MGKLELYLKGKKVIDQDVFLPEYDPQQVSFETRCELRQAYLDEQVADMFSNYILPIMKVDYDYAIIFKIQSKDVTQDV